MKISNSIIYSLKNQVVMSTISVFSPVGIKVQCSFLNWNEISWISITGDDFSHGKNWPWVEDLTGSVIRGFFICLTLSEL